MVQNGASVERQQECICYLLKLLTSSDLGYVIESF